MQYSEELDIVINNALKELIAEYTNNNFMFVKENNVNYLNLYLALKNEESKINFEQKGLYYSFL